MRNGPARVQCATARPNLATENLVAASSALRCDVTVAQLATSTSSRFAMSNAKDGSIGEHEHCLGHNSYPPNDFYFLEFF